MPYYSIIHGPSFLREASSPTVINHPPYKGLIIVRRRFLFTDPASGDEHDFIRSSRAACLDAALGALQIQHVLDEETCPGSQLQAMRWRVSSVMNHTFLTATMVLCSMVHRGQTLQREEEILAALRRARTVWMRARPGSGETR